MDSLKNPKIKRRITEFNKKYEHLRLLLVVDRFASDGSLYVSLQRRDYIYDPEPIIYVSDSGKDGYSIQFIDEGLYLKDPAPITSFFYHGMAILEEIQKHSPKEKK